MTKLRPWHWATLAIVASLTLLLLWLVLAYGELPRLWSKHEHRKVRSGEEILSYTAQDIPADPINLRLIGDRGAVQCAFARAGWSKADQLSARSAVVIVRSVVLQRQYSQAPVSSLYFRDRLQDLAYEREEGRSAHRRHHVRLWQVEPNEWMGAATYDRGVGLALFTLQVTHHIGADVDAERDRLGATLVLSGGRYLGATHSGVAPGRRHRNGGGDPYFTDGLIKTYALPRCSAPSL